MLEHVNMSEKATNSRPSWEVFLQCVRTVSTVFVISELTDHQRQVLYCFISGEDVFVNLPTGYGKSLIFHMAPLNHTWMHQNVSPDLWAKEPILLVISPLLALMQNQVQKLTSVGLKAAYVGVKYLRIDMSDAFALKQLADFPAHQIISCTMVAFHLEKACFLTGLQIPVFTCSPSHRKTVDH